MSASSSNGRTADSDSVNLGSSPGEAANKKASLCGSFFYWLITYGEEPSGSESRHEPHAEWRGGEVVRSSGFMPDTSR